MGWGTWYLASDAYFSLLFIAPYYVVCFQPISVFEYQTFLDFLNAVQNTINGVDTRKCVWGARNESIRMGTRGSFLVMSATIGGDRHGVKESRE